MITLPRPVVVLVCGEPHRGDDAAAFAAIDLLPVEIRVGADIRQVGALDVEDILSVDEGVACLIVDAVVGPPPGTIVRGSLASLARLDGDDAGPGPTHAVPDDARPDGPAAKGSTPDGAAPRSTHAMPAGQVLGLAAIVRPGLPPGSFVGIGGESFGLGTELSAEVERAIPRFAESIAAEIERLGLDRARG